MDCKVLNLNKDQSYILVGNGPSLSTKELGKTIDQYDEVIRFNKYKIEGFESHVGSKTTIYSTFGKDELPADENQRPSKIIFIHGDNGVPSYQPEYMMRIPLSFYHQLRHQLQEETVLQDDVNRLIPSSGILVMSYLLETFLNNITITGFDFFCKRIDSRHHYWTQKSFKRPKEHDGGWEYKKMLQYKKQGKINVL
jgi:hypothetical protein